MPVDINPQKHVVLSAEEWENIENQLKSVDVLEKTLNDTAEKSEFLEQLLIKIICPECNCCLFQHQFYLIIEGKVRSLAEVRDIDHPSAEDMKNSLSGLSQHKVYFGGDRYTHCFKFEEGSFVMDYVQLLKKMASLL